VDDLEKLKARFDICQFKARHLRMLDAKNWDEYAALLTDDFELDVTQTAPNVPVIKGREAAVNSVRASVNPVTVVHQAHVPEFFFDGDAARVIWAIQGRTIAGTGSPSYTGYGQHHDRWVKHGGSWKLAAQRLITLHMDVDPPAAIPPPLPSGGRHECPVKDLESIKARIEISRLKVRLYRMLDIRNWDEYGKILAEDCEMDLTHAMNVPVTRGRAAAVESSKKSLPGMMTAHSVHMGEFELNGDEARVIWAIQGRTVGAADQPSYGGYGQHHELWTRRNGEWKLTKQRLFNVHMDVFPPASGTTARAGIATLKTGA
jgi:hypothetical protein